MQKGPPASARIGPRRPLPGQYLARGSAFRCGGERDAFRGSGGL